MAVNKYFKKRFAGPKVTFHSFQYGKYRPIFIIQGISLIGTCIRRISTHWLVCHLTGSAFLPGQFGFAGQIPFISYITFAALSL